MIGDPSGRATERPLMDESTMVKNAKGIQDSLSSMFDFTSAGAGAVVVNNHDFYANMTAVQLIRDVGRCVPPAPCDVITLGSVCVEMQRAEGSGQCAEGSG